MISILGQLVSQICPTGVATMATIEERNGKYRAKVRMNGTSKSATFASKRDAIDWARRQEAKALDGVSGSQHRLMTFGEVLERYNEEVTPTKRGAREEGYRIGRLLKEPISSITLNNLTSLDFSEWRDNRLTEVSADSVNRELSTLSAVCNKAMKDWGLLNENYCHKISKPKGAKARDRRISDKEIEALCLHLGYQEELEVKTISQRVAVAILFSIETAMRSGEVCNLTWNHVHFDKRTAHLDETKNGSSRDVPLSRRAMALLEKLRGLDDVSVFDLSNATRDSLFRRARDSAGIENLHFHDTRREALSRMAGKFSAHELAKISGHKDVNILINTYYKADIEEFASRLD